MVPLRIEVLLMMESPIILSFPFYQKKDEKKTKLPPQLRQQKDHYPFPYFSPKSGRTTKQYAQDYFEFYSLRKSRQNFITQ
jgi:hypothetical protein